MESKLTDKPHINQIDTPTVSNDVRTELAALRAELAALCMQMRIVSIL